MRMPWIVGISLLVSIAGLSVRADPDPPAGPGSAAEVPVDEFMRAPLLRGLQISPDGRFVAAIYSRVDDERVVLFDLEADTRQTLLRLPDDDSWLAWVDWASDDTLLLSVDLPVEDVNTGSGRAFITSTNPRGRALFALPREGGRPKRLSVNHDSSDANQSFAFVPSELREDRVVDLLPDDEDHILVQSLGGVYRLNVRRSTSHLVTKPMRGIDTWLTDGEGRVRVGFGWTYQDQRMGSRDAALRIVTRARDKKDFETIGEFSPSDPDRFQPLKIDDTRPDRLYVLRLGDGGRREIWTYDLATHRMAKRLAADPRFDMEGLVLGRRGERVIGVSYVTQSPQIRWLRKSNLAASRALASALDGILPRPIDESRDGRRRLIRVQDDIHPPTYYLFEAPSGELKFLFDSFPELRGVQLSPTTPFRFEARDGVEIDAYLNRPRAQGDGERSPLVVLVHGGPASRDDMDFRRNVQLLASRGYAVLRVNFRGSSGYGEAFEALGHGQWGGRMQDDIEDAIEAALARGGLDPARVGIMGGSYGGYAALMGMVKTPTRYRCAASLNGVSDLVRFFEDEKGRSGNLEWFRHTIGDERVNRSRIEAVSPARHADLIRGPVLLGVGNADARVDPLQSKTMAAALGQAGKDVTLLEYANGQHFFSTERDEQAFYAAVLEFFGRCLAERPKD